MNSKRIAGIAASLALVLIASSLLCGCSLFEKEEKKQPAPVVQKKPVARTPGTIGTKEWMEQAEVIRTQDATIYYHGTAEGQLNEAGDWIGTIDGEVVMKDSGGLVTEARHLEIQSDSKYIFKGRTKIVLPSGEGLLPGASTP